MAICFAAALRYRAIVQNKSDLLCSSASLSRTAQSFCVPKVDIASQGYDLSLNRYKEVVHEEVEHRAPQDILADLAKLETEIQQGMKDLEALLK